MIKIVQIRPEGDAALRLCFSDGATAH